MRKILLLFWVANLQELPTLLFKTDCSENTFKKSSQIEYHAKLKHNFSRSSGKHQQPLK